MKIDAELAKTNGFNARKKQDERNIQSHGYEKWYERVGKRREEIAEENGFDTFDEYDYYIRTRRN